MGPGERQNTDTERLHTAVSKPDTSQAEPDTKEYELKGQEEAACRLLARATNSTAASA